MGSVTIFKVAEQDETLAKVKHRLDTMSLTKTQKVKGVNGETVELITTIQNVSKRSLGGEAAASGLIRYEDKYENDNIDGTKQTQKRTHTAEFVFIQNPVSLLVFRGNAEARRVAGKISKMLYNQSDDPILACRIYPHDLDEFIALHDPALRDCALGDMSMPEVSKVRFTGQNVGADPGYARYAAHGEKKSIRVHLAAIDRIISISGTASVRFYTAMELSETILFLREYILDMCK